MSLVYYLNIFMKLFGTNREKKRDMAKEKTYKEPVDKTEEAPEAAARETNAARPDDNVTAEAAEQTDTMADETASEAPDYEREAAEWKDKYLRLQAEFDNYRKRTLREKMELIETGGRDVLRSVLPIVDDVERAVDAAAKSDDIEALRRGMELIAQKSLEMLRQHKVERIEAAGKPFDEEQMEAVARFAAGAERKGEVIDVVQQGYTLGDKMLRFAKVVVGE